ncbi:MAG: RAMP superfamily CRISPR-associated protein [Bacteroidota bacterium]|nr:RAMP superfamily CRISPR-associated protein [Bacteroidota bacterium]
MDKLTHRYIARIVLEADTPLFVGSGNASLLKDAIVQLDHHGFPMIPGTSLTGVLRHALEDKENNVDWGELFGYQKENSKEGKGSRLLISSAYLITKNNTIAEGLEITSSQKDIRNNYFSDLPDRQHVRINHNGVADQEQSGLFDNEVVYKGCRFVFEMELKGTEKDKPQWEKLLSELNSPLFRIGQGTRNGYGRLKVHNALVRSFDLSTASDFEKYLNLDPSLNAPMENGASIVVSEGANILKHYRLELKPDDFFMFSAGYGDDEVDQVPKREKVLIYDGNGSISGVSEKKVLIPASSIKGALRHRTAFHYNEMNDVKADKINRANFEKIAELYTGINNDAVFELFGAEEGASKRPEPVPANREAHRGKIILNDVFVNNAKADKIFNHVAIDRFTGGAIDGALFSEKVAYLKNEDEKITLEITLEDFEIKDKDKDIDNEKIKANIINAFEKALEDMCSGLLPLGGMTTKGHGMFTGKLFVNNELKYDYDNA